VREHYLDVIRHSAASIGGIADDLAAAFRPGATDEPALLDLRATLKQCLTSLALEAGRAGVSLRFAATPEPSMYAYICRHQFERVVLSLVSLAMRRASGGGRAVQVSLIAADTELRVEVSDYTGKDPAAEKEKGGLALAIAKRVVERHGGAVWTGSGQAAGSFGLTLPRACVDLAGPEEPPKQGAWAAIKRLLTAR
jgi:signal transduction histidine kinase